MNVVIPFGLIEVDVRSGSTTTLFKLILAHNIPLTYTPAYLLVTCLLLSIIDNRILFSSSSSSVILLFDFLNYGPY